MAYAQQTAMAMASTLFKLEAESEGQVKIVRTADELQHCIDNDIFATIFHFEGAEAIDEDLYALMYFTKQDYVH